MLSIHDIRKVYITGDLKQVALDGVSLNLRDSEFVAVLGPSGSGKTTLLNIIGGLDRYDSGDVVINGVSTKDFSDRDWDSYRNHSVGFVFQSYNLIPHQTVLANVELALTISGVSRTERRERATKALTDVGLGDQLHKRPNQLSGGQMQRVAIARALVNDPEVLLADEPTGALDTQTSRQIMALLQEVASNRLVVMVTHNPELAEEYATRTIDLRDGKVISDSDPDALDEDAVEKAEHRNLGKASMSFLTALSLSFNNLRTKKGRTFLTAFAGSIGIIGIALILSLSNGVSAYIADTQKETMASYPITLESQALDLTSMIEVGSDQTAEEVDHDRDGVHSNPLTLEAASSVVGALSTNNLAAFKEYLDTPGNELMEHVGANGIVYSYPVDFDVYSRDQDDTLVNTDGSTFKAEEMVGSTFGISGGGQGSSIPGAPKRDTFQELIPSPDGDVVGALITDNYEVVAGQWPTTADEVVLVLDQNNEVPLATLYNLGVLPAQEYRDLLEKMEAGEDVEIPSYNWTYDELMGREFTMLPRADTFVKGEDGNFSEVTAEDELEELLDSKGITLTVGGIIRPIEADSNNPLTGQVGYTHLLTEQIIDRTNQSPVVQAQQANPDVNVLNGVAFTAKDDDAKVAEAISYLQSLPVSEKATLARTMMTQDPAAAAPSEPIPGMPTDEGMGMPPAMPTTEVEIAASFDAYLQGDPDRDAMLSLYETQLAGGSYDQNMTDFGVVDPASPSAINIYADSFQDKDAITAAINDYNESASVEDQITYTDYVGLLMSAITTIINVISYVLIAFVGVSLVVSSIMIGIITFISVLERTKEIGVLRAIGASKRNISAVFNAETVIVGFLAGVLGIAVTVALLFPINAIIHSVSGINDISAILPWQGAIILVVLSTLLTVVAGLIPARIAARKDPVAALRSE